MPTTERRFDYDVTVCAACLMASCWHGVWLCQEARSAGLTTRTARELDALHREDPSYYAPENIKRVTGCNVVPLLTPEGQADG